MSSVLRMLCERNLIHPPCFIASNLCYEVTVGSHAYGVAHDDSDLDIFGFCVPPKDVVFPHTVGVIRGFGGQGNSFDQYQQPHVVDGDGREYDLTIYNIIKYFKLCAECNPNMIDSLFVPDNCIRHLTPIGQLVRDNRRHFLSKMAWARFRGYAHAQLHKIDNKRPVGDRAKLVEAHGFDVKYGMHLVRLLDEVDQILTVGDIDIQRNSGELKAIRRGEWTEEMVRGYFRAKSSHLEDAYHSCKLPDRPDERHLKSILLACLEMHYGDISKCVVRPDRHEDALRRIAAIADEGLR